MRIYNGERRDITVITDLGSTVIPALETKEVEVPENVEFNQPGFHIKEGGGWYIETDFAFRVGADAKIYDIDAEAEIIDRAELNIAYRLGRYHHHEWTQAISHDDIMRDEGWTLNEIQEYTHNDRCEWELPGIDAPQLHHITGSGRLSWKIRRSEDLKTVNVTFGIHRPEGQILEARLIGRIDRYTQEDGTIVFQEDAIQWKKVEVKRLNPHILCMDRHVFALQEAIKTIRAWFNILEFARNNKIFPDEYEAVSVYGFKDRAEMMSAATPIFKKIWSEDDTRSCYIIKLPMGFALWEVNLYYYGFLENVGRIESHVFDTFSEALTEAGKWWQDAVENSRCIDVPWLYNEGGIA